MTEKLKPYLQAMPDIFRYVVAAKMIFFAVYFLLSGIANVLLRSVGRVAVTSGDWKFLYTTWQGILILLVSLTALYICVALDLNGKIALSSMLVKGERVSVRDCLVKGLSSIKKFVSPGGLLTVLYISFIAPVIGLGFSTSLTEGLYIPSFITDVVGESALYSSLAGIVIPLLLIIGIANLYILHGTVLDDLSVTESARQSNRLMRSNYRDYIRQNILFLMTMFTLIAIIAAACIALPLLLIYLIPMPQDASRFLTVFFVTAGVVGYLFADLFMLPLYLMKTTGLYYSYTERTLPEDGLPEVQRRPISRVLKALAAAAFIAAVAAQFICFDSWYPADTGVGIIAHRAGGSEAPENTLAGLDTAYRNGADGCEIDIQRTKDGCYVLNHDSTFERTAGDKRKPEEMDLSEIKALSVDGEPVAELEEVLAAAKGRLMLYIELKGSTADEKMADDVAGLVRKYGMEDECVLISLKYGLIDYTETEYPDIRTGFLAFASFGNTAGLNCDSIGLEAESATARRINSIHKMDKEVMVWTVNSKSMQWYFLGSDADVIITDNISQAADISEELASRSDLARMIDRVRVILVSKM